MIVTETEFKKNFDRYLDLLPSEDIFVTKKGKTIAKIIFPHVSAVDSVTGILAGKVSDDIDRHSLTEDRLEKYSVDD